jgi:uncharacterized membrane protein (DUF106 family)
MTNPINKVWFLYQWYGGGKKLAFGLFLPLELHLLKKVIAKMNKRFQYIFMYFLCLLESL